MDDLNDITVFAETNYRDQCRLFGIKRDDRRRHTYIIGKTGMGKSNLLEQLIFADIQSGAGIAVVDPHGELAEKVLDFIPSSRVNDVVYFNPSDMEFPIAFNILEAVNPEVKLSGDKVFDFSAALRSFLRYLVRKDLPVVAPEKIELPRTESRSLKFLEREQIERLVTAADTSKEEGTRDRAIMELLFSQPW